MPRSQGDGAYLDDMAKRLQATIDVIRPRNIWRHKLNDWRLDRDPVRTATEGGMVTIPPAGAGNIGGQADFIAHS